MITEFFSGAQRPSGHMAVVIGVGLAFLLVQLALGWRQFHRARRQDRMLRRLCREMERGGSGRRDPDDLPDSCDWVAWVLTAFPADAPASRPSFSRDEALHELDARITSNASYLLLQRMGIMAPLLGVLLTVVGFYWLEVDEAGEQSLQTILVAVTPLVSGVGAGALLALINQGVLQWVGGRIERLRLSARTWFDAAIWRHIGGEARSTADKSAAALERLASTVTRTADQYAASTGRIEACSESMKNAAALFNDMVHSFQGEIRGIPQALSVLRDAIAASARALQELLPMGARAISNLDVSVAAFRTTIDREFTGAAKLHDRSSRSLAATIAEIGDATGSLKSGADAMKLAAEANASTFENVNKSLSGAVNELARTSANLRRTIDSDVVPPQRSLHQAATSFAESADRLSSFIDEGLAPATRELAALHDTLSGLQGTVNSIRQFSAARADIDRLTATLARAAEIAEALSSLPDQVRGILEQTAAQSVEPAASRGRKLWIAGRPR